MPADLLDVTVIGAATPAQHVDLLLPVFHLQILDGQFDRVAFVQFLSRIQFLVTHGRGVGANAALAL